MLAYVQGDSEKQPNTKIAVSQKRVKIFASNFAPLFRTRMRLSALLRAIITSLMPNDANANFKNEFRN